MSASPRWPRRADGSAKMVSELTADEFAVQFAASRRACVRALPKEMLQSRLGSRDLAAALDACAVARMLLINADRAARAATRNEGAKR